MLMIEEFNLLAQKINQEDWVKEFVVGNRNRKESLSNLLLAYNTPILCKSFREGVDKFEVFFLGPHIN